MLAPVLAQMDGRFSTDPDPAGIQDYWWEQVSGPAAAILVNQDQPQFYANVSVRGSYLFSLTAGDSTALEGPPDYLRLNVDSAANRIPTANAGPDVYGVQLGNVISLDGSLSSDPEGATIEALWEQFEGPQVVLSDVNSLTPSFGPISPGWYRFRLFVRDAVGPWLDYDDVNISVSPAGNLPPLAVCSIHPISDADGDGRISWTAGPIFLESSASVDSDGPSALSRFWCQKAGPWVVLSDPGSSQPSFTPKIAGQYEFELIVSDGATEARASLHIVIDTVANSVPVASFSGASAISGAVGQTIVLNGSTSTDANGQPLLYQWSQLDGPIASLDSPYSATPSFVPNQDGVYSFQLVVSDGQASSVPVIMTVTISSAPAAAASGGGGGGGCSVAAPSAEVSCWSALIAYLLLLPLAFLLGKLRRVYR